MTRQSILVESLRDVRTTAISCRRSKLYVPTWKVNFITGCGFLQAAIDGCRSCRVAAIAVDVLRTFVVNMGQMPHVQLRFSHFQNYRRVSWCPLVLHATQCTVEHFVTALVNHFATLPPDIHNKRTALREVCLLTLYHHAQAFTVTRCHLWLTGAEFRVCAASTWFMSERIRPCGSKCCIVRTTSARDLSSVVLTAPTPDDLFFPMSTCANLAQHAWARCIMADFHNVHAAV